MANSANTIPLKSDKEVTVHPAKRKEDNVIPSSSSNIMDSPTVSKKLALEQRYGEFLKVVSEIGKDVKPTYTNSKFHSDRLKRNITTARSILRECLGELDRLNRQELIKESSNVN